jgi:endo-1,4-beta-xylanase
LYTDLGVEVAYTELDVRFTTPATPAKLKAQADAYARVVQSCINVKKCVGITIWVSFAFFSLLLLYSQGTIADFDSQGVSDKYSWIPGVFPPEGAALLWDENFNKKPAYSSVLKTIQAFKKS